MARPSKIDRLPAEIRDKIRDLRAAGRTIDEIHAKLEELDAGVSRAGVGRHIKSLDKILEMTRESRRAAEMIIERLGERPDNRAARANIELLHAQVMRLNTATENGEPVRFEPREVLCLSKALQSLTSAEKADLERDARLRARIREEERDRAKAEIEAAADKLAFSGTAAYKKALADVRRDVYGILDAPVPAEDGRR